jgi:outer membrane protein TolC
MRSVRAWLAAAMIVLAVPMVAPRSSRALDLAGALRDVSTANPTLVARSAMVDAARGRAGAAGAWFAPRLEVGVLNVPTTGGFDADPMTMKMIGVTQRLPVFGPQGLAHDAAREDVTRESATGTLTDYELLGMAWEAYADARLGGELARIAEQHGELMERLVQAARARFESGNGRLDDLLRSQVERATTLGDRVAFRAEEGSARAQLDALRGVAPGAIAAAGGAPDTLAPVPAPVATTVDAWLAAITPDHPRLRGLSAEASGYRFSARAARRSAWPDLELHAAYGFRQALAGPAGPIPQDDMFSATVGLTLPILSGGREHGEGDALDAMARVRDAEQRSAELELRREVVAAHLEAEAQARTEALLADTVITTLERAVDASWTGYRAGTMDLWRVFESAHALYGDEIALVRARQARARAESRLVALTGRTDLLGVALPRPAGTGGGR